MRTFVAIADLWGPGEKQRRLILGLPSRSTYQGWVKAVREHRDLTLHLDVLTRIAAILGINRTRGELYMQPCELDRTVRLYADADIAF